MMESGFTTMSEFEALVQQVVISERTVHNNFDIIGLSMSLRGKIYECTILIFSR